MKKIVIPMMVVCGVWNAWAGTGFALDLYGELKGEKAENLFFSPTSIAAALGMTYQGTENNTAKQMANMLGVPNDHEAAANEFESLVERFQALDETEGVELSVANSLWLQKTYSFRETFLKAVRASYNAAAVEVDYKADPEAVRERINVWVEDRTNDRIRDLIGRGVLTPMTRMVLVNAIYFLADWQTPFQERATENDTFMLADGEQADVPMMNGKFRTAYGEYGPAQLLELPYKGRELAMLIMLPAEGKTLTDVEQALTPEWLDAAVKSLSLQEVRIKLPRWTTRKSIGLKDPLMALGMKDAFTEKADLSGMGGEPGDLYVSAVIHQAFVDVNEKGTEAAAATAVGVTATAFMPEEPKVFRADHPFVYLIRDRKSGEILFLGRLSDPR